MNDETGYRFMHRANIMNESIKTASNDLLKIEGAAEDLLGRQSWDKEKDLYLVRDILCWALRTRTLLSEVSK